MSTHNMFSWRNKKNIFWLEKVTYLELCHLQAQILYLFLPLVFMFFLITLGKTYLVLLVV